MTIGINTRGLAYRPEYREWRLRVTCEFNTRLVSRDQVLALAEQAGWGVGYVKGDPSDPRRSAGDASRSRSLTTTNGVAGWARHGAPGQAWRGRRGRRSVAGLGGAWRGRHGPVVGAAGVGTARRGPVGLGRIGQAWRGEACQARPGQVEQGRAWPGWARPARQSVARLGRARRGRRGEAGFGLVRRGPAWRGMARQAWRRRGHVTARVRVIRWILGAAVNELGGRLRSSMVPGRRSSGVPALCDHPRCKREIERGFVNLCGVMPDVARSLGGTKGCGLYFCADHLEIVARRPTVALCARCRHRRPPFTPKPDLRIWLAHKLCDPVGPAGGSSNPRPCGSCSRSSTHDRPRPAPAARRAVRLDHRAGVHADPTSINEDGATVDPRAPRRGRGGSARAGNGGSGSCPRSRCECGNAHCALGFCAVTTRGPAG